MHSRTGGIYIASKTKHADKWKAYRHAGFPVASTWIDEAGANETGDWVDLWLRCVWEASKCAVLIAYREEGEKLKGTLVEVGCALSQGRLVLLTGIWDDTKFSFMSHPLVKEIGNVNTAFSIGMRASMKFAQQAAREENRLILAPDTKQ
jgi:hypothetical protein